MARDRRIRTAAGRDEEQPAYRLLPHNLEAEQGLLGTLMVDNSALERVSDFLRPCHFYVPVHQRLYEAILKLAERGQMAGPVTLKKYFERDGDLAQVGGAEYLAPLATGVITLINAEDYGRTIYDLHLRRELIALCQEVLHDAYEPRLEQKHGPIAIIEQTEGRLFRLAETVDTGRGAQTLYEALRRAAEHGQDRYGRQHRHQCRAALCPNRRERGGRGQLLLTGNVGRAAGPVRAGGAERDFERCEAQRLGRRGISTASPRSRSGTPACCSISNRLPTCLSTPSAPGPGA
jgi:DnaB-like helicase N terminal domain